MSKISLAFGGDVMLGRTVNEYMNQYEPAYPFGDVLPLLKNADLTFINLECVITSHKKESELLKPFYFRADKIAIDSLKAAGIDYVSLANNHILDFQEKGMLDCIKLLDKNGIKHAGAGKNLKEASKPALLETNGIKIAVLSYADHHIEWRATKNRPGINYTPITLDAKQLDRIKDSIKKAKELADFLIFSIHWGPNMRENPPTEFIRFAHAIIESGADIFHGHSAHIFQPVEIYNGRPIFYDCGDFVDDYAVDPDLRNDYALLYFVIIDPDKKKIEKIELIPCLIHSYKCQVNLAESDIFEEIYEKIKNLSIKFGTKIRREGNRLIIKLD